MNVGLRALIHKKGRERRERRERREGARETRGSARGCVVKSER